MKKIYSLMALMLMAVLSFAATAATAKVYIDNKSNVYLYTNGDDYDRVEDKLVNGQFVDITFTEGLTWNLDSSHNLTFYQIVRNGEVIASNIKPVLDVGFDFEVNDGDVIEIFVNAPASDKPTAQVYVDQISYSLFIYDSAKDDWIDITSQLTPGNTAIIEFDPETQSMWNVEGAGSFYLIEKDGEALLQDSPLPGGDRNIYGMRDGSELKIYVKNPEAEMATITVDYGEYGEDAIKYMEVNEDYVVVSDGKFKAENGALLVIYPDTQNYTIKSITLGDQELQFIVASGCYAGIIDGSATLTIVAEPKPDAEVTLTINDANSVEVYKAYYEWFIGDEEITGLANGDNKIMVSPLKPFVEIKAKEGYEIVSATYTDTEGVKQDLGYNSWDEFYYVDVINSNAASINIETKEKVVEYVTFGVAIADVSVLKSYFIRTNKPREFIADSDDPDLLLHNGINMFTVTTEQAASIRINLEFIDEPITDVTIDGTPVKGIAYEEYDNSVWGDFSIADGQILYIGKTDGISNIGSDNRTGKIYNMQGIEVKGTNLPAGIYIINGKKTYVKSR